MRKVQADFQKLQSHIDGGNYRQTMRDDIRNHVAHLKEEVGFLNSALDSHIEKFGAINHEAREIIGKTVDAENAANRILNSAEKTMSRYVRLVVFIAIALAVLSGTLGYFAALKFETDTGTWAHQLQQSSSPGRLCGEMGFQYERDLADNNTHYCSKAITKNRRDLSTGSPVLYRCYIGVTRIGKIVSL